MKFKRATDTITLYTLQSKSAIDTLEKDGIYIADYNKLRYKDYVPQYKELAKFCEFNNCPIFCVDKDNLRLIEASNLKTDDNHILLKLKVPREEVVRVDYYSQSDYLYWSSSEDDKEFKMTMDQSLKNIDKYVVLDPPTNTDVQYLIDRIEKDWVI